MPRSLPVGRPSRSARMTAAETASHLCATIMFATWMIFLVFLGLWMNRVFPGAGGFPKE